MDAALVRTLRIRGNYTLDVRLQAENVLNHTTFTAWNNVWSPTASGTTFGLPVSVNGMRNVQLSGRFRF
jgi:hypothetical protein